MNRRKFLQFLAAGGVVTAAGLWMPGQKLISIPNARPLIIGTDFSYNPSTSAIVCLKVGPNGRATIMDLYNFMTSECPGQIKGLTLMTDYDRSADITLDEAMVDNPEFIRAGNGSLTQDGKLYVGLQSASINNNPELVQYSINGTPAVHPGPVDQLVRADVDTKIQVRAEPDMNGKVQRFQQFYAQKGANVVWPDRLETT